MPDTARALASHLLAGQPGEAWERGGRHWGWMRLRRSRGVAARWAEREGDELAEHIRKAKLAIRALFAQTHTQAVVSNRIVFPYKFHHVIQLQFGLVSASRIIPD